MTVDVLALGESLSDYKHTGNITIGVNDIYSRGIKTDYLVLVDPPGRFEPDRLKSILDSKPKYFYSNNIEWSSMVSNFRHMKLSNIRYSLKDLDEPYIYPYSNNSAFSACVLAYKIGAKEIITWGADFNTHAVLSKPETKQRIKDTFKDLRKALNIRGVKLICGSKESILSEVLPTFQH